MSAAQSMSRRSFLKSSSLAFAGAALVSLPIAGFATGGSSKFKLALNPGIIGVKANQEQLIEYAAKYGFEAITPFPTELSMCSASKCSEWVSQMKAHWLSWDSTNLPVEFRKDEAAYRSGLQMLPTAVKALQTVGATRMNTWVLPAHQDLTYRENFEQHARRLRECAKIANDSGIRLGLEYVGPKTKLTAERYPFIRTMREMRELIAEINQPNVGLVLDSFHWHCAEDTAADIMELTPNDVVTVDINDARSDLSREQQIDSTRELPLATGVIDLKAFLSALVQIGYEGPIRAEPFNAKLNEMENDEALATCVKAMRAAFVLV